MQDTPGTSSLDANFQGPLALPGVETPEAVITTRISTAPPGPHRWEAPSSITTLRYNNWLRLHIRPPFLSFARSGHGSDRQLRHLFPRFRHTPGGRHRVRHPGRPTRPQVRAHGDHPSDGGRQHVDRRAPVLRHGRHLGADHADRSPPDAGTWSGRGTGRRRRAHDRGTHRRQDAAISPPCPSWASSSAPFSPR